MSRHDLRRESRQSCAQPVGIMWSDAAGGEKFVCAPVRDISKSGAGLQIPEPVAVRSFVTLYADKLGLHGQASVRYCTREGLRYRVGVEFASGMRWKAVEQPTPAAEPEAAPE